MDTLLANTSQDFEIGTPRKELRVMGTAPARVSQDPLQKIPAVPAENLHGPGIRGLPGDECEFLCREPWLGSLIG
jgi:hypothetical protein